MELIVRPTHDLGAAHPFAALAARHDQQARIVRAIQSAVDRSFAEDAAQVPAAQREHFLTRVRTTSEERRRVQLAFEAIRAYRHHHYSLQRALDELPRALRARLEGQPLPVADNPSRLWTPT